jgi:hypothetical protein
MFMNKLKEYGMVKWATATYETTKARHAWFKYGAETAERITSSVVPRIPGAHTADALAAGAVGRVEAIAGGLSERLGARVDACLAAAQHMAEERCPASRKAVVAALGACSAAVAAVLPVVAVREEDVPRVPADAVPHGVLQALDKHIDLAHEIRRRVLGKTPLGIACEVYHSSLGIARMALRYTLGMPRRTFDWVLAAFKRRSPKAYETSAAVASRAMQELQELGERTTKAAENTRDIVRRRVAAATGRTGVEPGSTAAEQKKSEPAAPSKQD